MKILTFLVGIAIAFGGVASTAPAEAQSYQRDRDGRSDYRGDRDVRNDRRDDRRWNNGRRDDRRWNNGHRNDHRWKNYRKRCTYVYRNHRKIRVCNR